MKEEVRMKERTTKSKTIIRKTIGLLMCLAMVAIMLPTNVAKATSTNGPVIDTSKKGSITIHKYEYNGSTANPSPTPVAGNGKPNQTIPSGAVALEGAGFTIYKVADLDSYYGISGAKLPDATTYYTYDADSKTYTVTSGTKVGNEQKTNSSGETTFTSLELGIYLVIETTTPDKVTTPIAPFLVSVPMTTAEGDDWLYEVHVYPKNATTYGGIKLLKTGVTGNDSQNPTAMQGVTFVLQKKKDDGTYETVTKNDKGVDIGTNGTLTTNTEGKIEVSDLSPGEYRFIETGNVGTSYGYILDGVTGYTFKINDDASVTYTNNTPTTVPSGGTDTYISVVNQKPDVEKKVMNSDETPVPTKQADYSVGDTISYQVEVKVPSNIAKLRKFQLSDTPQHIKYTAGTLKVYANANKTSEITAGVTVVADTPTNGFTVTFDTSASGGIANYAGQSIYVFYDAVLQSGALTEKGGNVNTVDLIYENKILPTDSEKADGNPNPTPNVTPGPDETYEIKDSATVYTFKMTVHKTGDNNANLQGVKFDLYKEVESGTAGALTEDQAKALGLPTTATWKHVEELTTNANGQISPTDGLANGTYYLVETETNDGYNLLSKPVKVELKVEYTTTFKATSTDSTVTTKNEVDAGNSTLTEKMSVNDAEQNSFTVNIKNSKGFTLPTTGGAGGFLFTLVGCCIMILGIIIFCKTRNKQAAN